MNQQLEKVLERVRALPDHRHWEIAEVFSAALDQQRPDVSLSRRKIVKAERTAANDRRFATDKEVRAVFARLTQLTRFARCVRG